VDVVVKGEGEVAFPAIVDTLENMRSQPRVAILEALSKIAGVNVRSMPWVNDFKILTLGKEAFQSLPFPDLSASPVHMYRAPDAERFPMVTMMTQVRSGC
jgi:radical SAM superfamily enzyme YgiQ (UPF0313 family)